MGDFGKCHRECETIAYSCKKVLSNSVPEILDVIESNDGKINGKELREVLCETPCEKERHDVMDTSKVLLYLCCIIIFYILYFVFYCARMYLLYLVSCILYLCCIILCVFCILYLLCVCRISVVYLWYYLILFYVLLCKDM